MPADIILYALVAAGLVFWLRSILGTRHGEERERPNPFAQQKAEAAPDAFTPSDRTFAQPVAEEPPASLRLPPRTSIASRSVEEGLMDIVHSDRGFDLIRFMNGAQEAFVMIVEAFAKGDKATLQELLADPVYKAFSGAIAAREKMGETVSTEIHAVRKSDIIEASLKGHDAFITIRFTADETCVVRDKDGKILSGNPDRITEMVDVWTFTRDVKSKDPTWGVCETRDDKVEDKKAPLPEAR